MTGTYDENNPSAQSVSVTNNNKMTDASFDHVSGKVYQPQVRTTSEGDSFATVADTWSTTSGTSTFYYAVSWRMTFKYRLPSVVTDTYLYLDGSLSQIAQASGSAVTNNDAAQDSKAAFRLMFTQGEGANINYVLWAPERNMSETKVKYIQDNADTTGDSNDGKKADYGASFKIVHAGNKASLTEDAAVSTGANVIGQIAKTSDTPNSQVTLPVTCTAWFEGCDPSVVNLTKMYAIVASLSFFVK